MSRACYIPDPTTATGRRLFDPDNWDASKDPKPQLYPIWGTTPDELSAIGGAGVRVYFAVLRFLPLAFTGLALIMAPPVAFNLNGGMFELDSRCDICQMPCDVA